MSVGQRIALLRKHKAMTQEELANILGTTRQAISKWESGKSLPDIDYAIKIGEYFGVSMDYLLLGQSTCDIKQQPEIKSTQKQNNRIPSLFAAFATIGILIMALMPLAARIYRNYIFTFEGTAYTNPNLYLTEWPLLFYILLSIFVYGKLEIQ